jgi:hypothetical protein
MQLVYTLCYSSPSVRSITAITLFGQWCVVNVLFVMTNPQVHLTTSVIKSASDKPSLSKERTCANAVAGDLSRSYLGTDARRKSTPSDRESTYLNFGTAHLPFGITLDTCLTCGGMGVELSTEQMQSVRIPQGKSTTKNLDVGICRGECTTLCTFVP